MIKCNCCGRENSNYAIYCEGCGSLLSTVSDSAEVKTEVSDSSSYSDPAPEAQAYESSSDSSSSSAYEPVQAGPVQSGSYDMPPEYTYNPNPATTSGMEFDGMCIAGFICSLTGMFCCGLPAFVGLILSIIGLVRTSTNGKKGRGLAVAGLIISILAIIVAIIILIASNGNSYSYYSTHRR